jgi:hypothetical protein
MKVKCFMIFVILVVGISLATAQQQIIAYQQTPTPPISELANLSFKLGMAYQQAQLCQNFTVYNSLVDQYNAWVRQHFGEGANALLKSKITATNLPGVAQPQVLPEIPTQQVTENPYSYPSMTKNPFNASSDLSKFGKQQVFSGILGWSEYMEDTDVYQKMKNF